MTLTEELSPQLAEYASVLEAWSAEIGRPYAREADRRHAPPDEWSALMASCPVPIGRSGDDHLPTPPDGRAIQQLVMHESLNYGDTWMFGTLGLGIGHLVVEAMGTSEQIARWYDPVVADELTTAFGLTEPECGSDTSMLRTTATRDGDHWVLNGAKMYCSKAASAIYTVIFATLDISLGPAGIKAFVVPNDAPGFIVLKANEDKLGMRSWSTSSIALEDCAIPIDHLLGGDADGGEATRTGRGGAFAALGYNRPNMAAIALGLARAALDLTTDELRHRRTGFIDRRWAIIEDDLEKMRAAITRGRRMTYRAQELNVRGTPDRTISAMAKLFAPETAERIILRCMQLLGPDGASEELLLEKWWRDCKILDIFEGTGQIQRLIVGRGLMGRAVG